MEVNVNNVKECWEYYESYVEEHRKRYYSNVSADDFVSWCEDNLVECPACGMIVLKESLDENFDNVCEECVNNGYYE